MKSGVNTRFLILSDTHGVMPSLPSNQVDVAIHCGDLTEESKIEEFKVAIDLLKGINTPLKLVIAGNHDFTLDLPMFRKKLADIKPPLDDELMKREYGGSGEARALFDNAKDAGIVFLDEGTHHFTLANGAQLTVYASPYTPSLSDWGFQYHPQEEHEWAIGSDVDVVITHGPPRGMLDYTDSKERAGSPSLFAAVAHARPRLHCFGHIHESWGAKMITWRDTGDETPSHFTAIDNDQSSAIESLATLRAGRTDTSEETAKKIARLSRYVQQRYCVSSGPIRAGEQTLFVNAAIEGTEDHPMQLPWIVDVSLPASTSPPAEADGEKNRQADGDTAVEF